MNDVSTGHACSDGECRAGKRIATRMDFLNFVHHQQNKSFPTLRKIFCLFTAVDIRYTIQPINTVQQMFILPKSVIKSEFKHNNRKH